MLSHGIVRDCLFLNGAAPLRGGAATCSGPGTVEFHGNTSAGCSGTQVGAAFNLISDTVVFRNNIVAYSSGGPAVRVSSLVDSIDNGCNVFWANADGDFDDYVPAPTDRLVDPQFCAWESGDVALRDGSPCLPEGSNGCGMIGAYPEGCGTVSVEPVSWGMLKSLYREERGP